jgi:diadenosine tetraphosphate (Ap4A) HIT family hydrolase
MQREKGECPEGVTSSSFLCVSCSSEVPPLTALYPQIAHYPTLLSIPADASQAIIDEIASYKEALKKCYAKYGAKLIAFEVGKLSGKGGHAHVQVSHASLVPCRIAHPSL